MAFTGPAEDRLAIRELMDAYSDAVFHHDADNWISNWASDAVWRMPSVDVSGSVAIKAAWVKAMSAFKFTGFFSSLGSIEVDGDAATARSYATEILETQDGSMLRLIGTYDDKLVKRDGRWLFASRIYKVLRQEA